MAAATNVKCSGEEWILIAVNQLFNYCELLACKLIYSAVLIIDALTIRIPAKNVIYAVITAIWRRGRAAMFIE